MGVVGQRQGDPGVLAEGNQALRRLLFLGNPVVLDLQEKVLAEELFQFQCPASGLLGVPAQKGLGDFPREAARQAYQALCVAVQQLPVAQRFR